MTAGSDSVQACLHAIWPFPGLERGVYRTILADPPWQFKLHSAKGEKKSPQAHYACMGIADLRRLPVGELAARDCNLIMWATSPMLDQQIDLLKAWGFAFKGAGAWAKQSSTGSKWAFGPGYVWRSAAEFWLHGTRGKPAILSHSIRNLIAAPAREHSRKPDEMHRNLEALFEGPRCELFAREQRPGWDVWGNQTDKFSPQPTMEDSRERGTDDQLSCSAG